MTCGTSAHTVDGAPGILVSSRNKWNFFSEIRKQENTEM